MLFFKHNLPLVQIALSAIHALNLRFIFFSFAHLSSSFGVHLIFITSRLNLAIFTLLFEALFLRLNLNNPSWRMTSLLLAVGFGAFGYTGMRLFIIIAHSVKPQYSQEARVEAGLNGRSSNSPYSPEQPLSILEGSFFNNFFIQGNTNAIIGIGITPEENTKWVISLIHKGDREEHIGWDLAKTLDIQTRNSYYSTAQRRACTFHPIYFVTDNAFSQVWHQVSKTLSKEHSWVEELKSFNRKACNLLWFPTNYGCF